MITVRRADAGDISTIAGHRAAMFAAMGILPTTSRAERRRGVARQLMESILTWAGEVELESLVLHASADGRALYEHLGFAPTNEMRFMGSTVDPQLGRTSNDS